MKAKQNRTRKQILPLLLLASLLVAAQDTTVFAGTAGDSGSILEVTADTGNESSSAVSEDDFFVCLL